MATSSICRQTTYKDFSSTAFSTSTGTIGAFMVQQTFDCSLSGKTPIYAVLTSVEHAGAYHPFVYLSGNTLALALYRALNEVRSFSAGDIKMRVFYE